jgi:hypothetical protein
MDLSSTFYMLLQDHFPNLMKSGWPPELVEAALKLPRLPTASFEAAFKTGRDFDATWWYSY